ncbi:MAG: phage portal protein [Clostridia bacterium]|nr:phage portal protein [Clostridia bacterium]
MWPFTRKKNEQRARDKPDRLRPTRRQIDLIHINRPRADRTIEGNEAIYAAVSRIANTMASMPMHIYKGWEPQPGHPMERLVNLEPHPNFTAFSWRQTMEVLRNTEGNAYALKVLDKLGGVQRLDILNPTRVQPMRNPKDGSIWYSVTMDNGQPSLAPGSLVLSLKHMSANGEKGIRPIDVLRKSLDYDTQVKELGLDQLDGVNNGIMLTVPNTGLSQEQKDDAVDRFLETYKNSGRSVVVLEGGLTATHFESQAVNAQMLDVERITRNKVATVYNLPPHMLGDYSDTSYSTAEQQLLEFMQLTIIPIVEQWEEEFNRKLLTPQDWADGYRFRFDTSALTRADVATTANKNQMAIRGSWMKPNEVRRMEGLPDDPRGDELMCSRDLLPLRIAMDNPELLLSGGAARKEEES